MHSRDKRIIFCPEEWTKEEDRDLFKKGYWVVDKFKDQLRYAGITVYIRLHDFTVVDLSDPETAKRFGYDRPVNIGSAEMHDFLKSNTLSRFMVGFTRVSFAPIDVKMLIFMIPIIAGIILGMLYFMG